MSFFLGWLVSATITRLSRRYLSGKYHWYFILAKDFAIGSLVIGLTLAVSFGKFNSCFCWSAYFSRFGDAYVEVQSDYFDKTLRELTKTEWPILVALGVGGQAVMVMLMGWGNSQGALLFCRSERERDKYFEKLLLTQAKTIERRCSETESKVGEKRSAAGVCVGEQVRRVLGRLPVSWGLRGVGSGSKGEAGA